MRTPLELQNRFREPFSNDLELFCKNNKLISADETFVSPRFLKRSVVPHIQTLSDRFNRLNLENQGSDLGRYWTDGSKASRRRAAYFTYFNLFNLYRNASVWTELERIGLRWDPGPGARAVELGAGMGAGAAGYVVASQTGKGLPKLDWALVERDREAVEIGASWLRHLNPEVSVKTYNRRIDPSIEWLPRSAPRFKLWVMSYFLNEVELTVPELAQSLIQAWDRHLEQESLIVIVEPALRAFSRKLLELRAELLRVAGETSIGWLQLLLPCLGHQACGALQNPEDWCHEEVSWWRPDFVRRLDQELGLDHKTLPFSYLVVAKTTRSRADWLTRLPATGNHYRLVSNVERAGPDNRFFICGEDGKHRARIHRDHPTSQEGLERGDILSGVDKRGDAASVRIDKASL